MKNWLAPIFENWPLFLKARGQLAPIFEILDTSLQRSTEFLCFVEFGVVDCRIYNFLTLKFPRSVFSDDNRATHPQKRHTHPLASGQNVGHALFRLFYCWPITYLIICEFCKF